MSSSETWLIGVDGGGTKTHVVISNQRGQTIAEAFAGGSNLHLDPDYVRHSLIIGIQKAISNVSQKPVNEPRAHVCFGLSGLDTQSDQHIIKPLLKDVISKCHIAKAETLYCSDGLIGLYSQESVDWGICLIASTGSNCFGINQAHDQCAAAGDWGYLFGDQGSAFHIGQSLIQTSLQEYDGRSNDTGLMKLILTHLNLSSPDQLIELSYQPTLPIKSIASLATLLAQVSPHYSETLIKTAAKHYLQSCQAVLRRTNTSFEEKIPIVLIGGLLNYQPFAHQLRQELTQAFPHSIILKPALPPVYGAIRILKQHSTAVKSIPAIYTLE